MFSRRDIGILSGAGLALGLMSTAGCKTSPPQIWNGDALGAPSFLKIRGVSAPKAQSLFAMAETEIARLSNIFSLREPTSEIFKLNKYGHLLNASPEIIEVLQAARQISDLTNGAFDITVQSLWNTAAFLTRAKVTKEGQNKLWAKAYGLVDYKYVEINGAHVSFARPGVTITLNGLAQGYITDKITQLLLSNGVHTGLVNIGEFRAFGPKTWKLGIQDPSNIMDVAEIISLKNAALATSSAKGGYLSAQMSHIFQPRTGYKKPQFISASVVHNRAIMADGFATAFTLLGARSIRAIMKKTDIKSALLIQSNGDIIKL